MEITTRSSSSSSSRHRDVAEKSRSPNKVSLHDDDLSSVDSEKGHFSKNVDQHEQEIQIESDSESATDAPLYKRLAKLSAKLDSLGVEIYGIQRRLPESRHSGSLHHVLTTALLWVSGAGGLTSLSAYILGPIVFDLGFKDAMVSATIGTIVGCSVAAYGATMGPRSGLRQMVGCRFQFGWYFAKVLALINVVTLLGWAVVSCVFGGQILSAVSDNKMPLEGGIVINAGLAFIIATIGLKFIQYAESWSAIPMMITFTLLYGVSGKHFDITLASKGDSPTIIANWLSFFTTLVGTSGTWVAITSDYYVEYPATFPKWKVFALTFTSIFLPSIYVGFLGVGLGAGAVSNPDWNDGWKNLGAGGVLSAAFGPWKGGGKFLLVILYISLINNNIINAYSIALSLQVWGRWVTKVPRYIMTFVSVTIFFVLAIAGRNRLSDILSNFLPMTSYWCVMYIAVLIEENVFFRKKLVPGFDDTYDWRIWNEKPMLEWRLAGAAAFLIGIPGAVLGMCQVYFVGPIAKRIGVAGGDIGVFLSFSFAAIAYLPLRYLERKYQPQYRMWITTKWNKLLRRQSKHSQGMEYLVNDTLL